jgi:uncharacterized protein (TIGR02466 family)
MFPTLIGVNVNPNHDDSLVSKCLDIESSVQSGGQSWVSKDTYNTMGSHDILKDKDFESINDFVVSSVRQFCKELRIDLNEILPTDSWVNIYRKGDYQEYHNHNPDFLSAIYYLKTPKDSSSLFIKNPFGDMIAPDYTELTIDNKSRQEIEPKDGMLVIFRSHIEHCVEKHMSDEPRISLAYNFSYSY